MNEKRVLILTVGLVLTFILAGCGAGQTAPVQEPSPTAAEAVMTPGQQISAGQQVFAQSCARCHGADLEGATGPQLATTNLSAYVSADKLVGFVSQAMPGNAPGSLGAQQYYDVVAFILDEVGLLPADQAVTPETAADILLR